MITETESNIGGAAKTIAAAPKVDYSVYIGRTFKTKNEAGLNSERTFTVAQLIPSHQFGPQGGGKRPAFVLHRNPPPGVHTQRCDKFLENHVEVKPDSEV